MNQDEIELIEIPSESASEHPESETTKDNLQSTLARSRDIFGTRSRSAPLFLPSSQESTDSLDKPRPGTDEADNATKDKKTTITKSPKTTKGLYVDAHTKGSSTEAFKSLSGDLPTLNPPEPTTLFVAPQTSSTPKKTLAEYPSSPINLESSSPVVLSQRSLAQSSIRAPARKPALITDSDDVSNKQAISLVSDLSFQASSPGAPKRALPSSPMRPSQYSFNFVSESIESSGKSLFPSKSPDVSIEIIEPDRRSESSKGLENISGLVSRGDCASQFKVPSDPVEESPFSFSQKPKPSNVLDIANWLSEDSSPQSSPAKPKKPAAKPRRTKTKEMTHHLSDRTFTPKELQQANKQNRRRTELLAEMELFISRSVSMDLAGTRFESECPMGFWERKATSIYDEKTDTFIPCNPYRIVERNVLMLYSPEEFLQKAEKCELESDIETARKFHANRMATNKHTNQTHQTNAPVIVLVLGWDMFIQKLKQVENKHYRNRVLNMTSPNKRRKTAEVEMTHKEAEHIFNRAQLRVGANVLGTRNDVELAEWIEHFTYTIAKARYDKYRRNAEFGNLGHVKSGTDGRSTMIQSLRQFRLMTETRAEAVVDKFKTMYAIQREYEKSGSLGQDGGRNLVPPSVDLAMKKVFLGSDPDEIIFE